MDVSWCVAPPGGDSGASSRWFSGGPGASQLVLVVENPPASEGDLRGVGSVPGLGRFPRGGHSNPQYAWRIPRKEEPGPLQSIGSQRDTTAAWHACSTWLSEPSASGKPGGPSSERGRAPAPCCGHSGPSVSGAAVMVARILKATQGFALCTDQAGSSAPALPRASARPSPGWAAACLWLCSLDHAESLYSDVRLPLTSQ